MTTLLLFLSLCWADWTVINITDGITVSQKTIPNSDLFAFRGEGVVDVHISKLQSVLFDEKRGSEWVDLMEEAYPVTDWNVEKRIIYQKYDLPWPIQDRDYVMTQNRKINVDTKTITATYQSIESKEKPQQECCIRAYAQRTYWKMEALPNGQTRVAVEVQTDPKGALPAWLINMIQRDWPYNSITRLTEQAQRENIVPEATTTEW